MKCKICSAEIDRRQYHGKLLKDKSFVCCLKCFMAMSAGEQFQYLLEVPVRNPLALDGCYIVAYRNGVEIGDKETVSDGDVIEVFDSDRADATLMFRAVIKDSTV